MIKRFLILFLGMSFCLTSYSAWDPDVPADDEKLVDTPALIRANWDAIELGTDTDLLITNAKCSSSMALVDTKLAQITTAGKVSGASITLLTSVPSGAGVLPVANSPCKLKADSSDTTPQYLDSLINTDMFKISASDTLEFATSVTNTNTWANLGVVTTADINGGTIDGVTIGASSAPTVTNLGSVTTCDINGGTMDGVQIGATTATGELIVNNASDDADGLGSQGTAGQVLTSAGAGANPTWSTVSAANTSNCVFSFAGSNPTIDSLVSNGYGYVVSSTLTPSDNLTYAYWTSRNAGYQTVIETKFKKIAGISTVTFYAQVSGYNGTPSVEVDIGGQSANDTAAGMSVEWISGAIDVSGLTNGTVYDVDIDLKVNEEPNKVAILWSIIGIGS